MVKINDTFTDTHADGIVRFTVMSKRAGDVWNCKVVDDMDWAGLEKVYTTAQIETHIAKDKTWRKFANEHDIWWATREIGETVHYSNGRKQFVRGVVVETEGRKKMKPTALVGEWHTMDFPRYDRKGDIVSSTYPTCIANGTPMQPNCSNMYECPTAPCRNYGFDPTNLPALDLTPVPLLPELQAMVPYERARHEMILALQAGHADPKATLQAVHAAIGAVLETNKAA